ncbi:MAG: glycoside hydrolase [Hyperionvirus sp.]|uniref:Glycoside hydrolase n=1 Tax=Hyperionvirus sp. TaxID=2487770 RepID=A0A3G5A6Q3_9VIRU|nr:MAG: glycoside hydrolase [Hyperionvirus sp.]
MKDDEIKKLRKCEKRREHRKKCRGPQPFNPKILDTIFPKKVIYMDAQIDWGNPLASLMKAIDDGYNVINLAFYLDTGPFNMVDVWRQLSKTQKETTIKYAHDRNAVILVSAGGATTPGSLYQTSPEEFATEVCDFANANLLDGVDYDLEHIEVGFMYGPVKIIDWLNKLNDTSREILGDDKLITHAPQAPYFGAIGSTSSWAGASGGYSGVYQHNKTIDWFNIQFYNQDTSSYDTYATLFTQSNGYASGTSVSQIASYGIPLEKLIVGKPLTPEYVFNSGYVTPSNLHNYFNQAKNNIGWNAGLMFWQWNTGPEPKNAIDIIYP